MSELRTIVYGTPEYAATLALRNKVMRIPLGLNIYNEDFSCEAASTVIGIFDGDTLLATGTMSCPDGQYKIDYLCVDFDLQGTGLGGRMLEHFEGIVRAAGCKKLVLDARLTAQAFYESHGFIPVGEVFVMAIAPVDHIAMEKHF